MALPGGCRRNNPLNLRPTNPPFNGTTGQDGGYSTFDTMQDGIRAAAVNARTHAGRGETLQQFIYAVGPASDGNDPAFYTNYLKQALGGSICPNTPLSQIAATQAGMAALLTAMIKIEVGGQCGLDQVAAGVAAAFS